MSKESTAPATNEELLRKVIDAQMTGGCPYFEQILDSMEAIEQRGFVVGSFAHILEILLDTPGCKAAYTKHLCPICYRRDTHPDAHTSIHSAYHGCMSMTLNDKSKAIVEAWNSGSGNNCRAALETAVSFLL